MTKFMMKVFNTRQMAGKFAKCAMLATCFGMIMGMSGVADAADPFNVKVNNARGVTVGYLLVSGDSFKVSNDALGLADDITVSGTITGGSFAVVGEETNTIASITSDGAITGVSLNVGSGNFTVSGEGNTAVNGTLGVTGMAVFNGGIDVKGNKIVNIGAGDITSATSADAVNGGQLFTMTNVESAGNYIEAGTGVASNLAALDGQVKANTDDLVKKADKTDVENAVKQGNENTLKAAKEYTDNRIKDVTIAVGDSDKNNATVGYDNGVEGVNSNALGTANQVIGTNSTAVGSKNIVNGNSSGAFGDPNIVNGNGSYALGNDNTINADHAFALGNNAAVSANGSIAIGDYAEANHANSVALGARAVTDRENSVAVGNRQITGVKDGTAATDAVNKKQLDEVSSKAMSQIDATNDRVNRVGATAAALAAINYQPMSKGQSQVAVGMGGYKGKKATALGFAYQISNRVSGAVAGAANGSEHMFNVGFNYLFGQHSNKDVVQMSAMPGSMTLKEAELQSEVNYQNIKINNLEADNALMKAKVAELEAIVTALVKSK